MKDNTHKNRVRMDDIEPETNPRGGKSMGKAVGPQGNRKLPVADRNGGTRKRIVAQGGDGGI